ncbi:MAG: sulfotransferase, partial [Actinomycetota bacterium]|nr:sulfotransferase [Actinomycetota bacterium]
MHRTAQAEPFFIVGSARSGTSLLRLMLNAHPDIAVPSESRFIVELWPGVDDIAVEEFLAELSEHRLFALWGISIEAVRSEIGVSRRCRYSDAVAGAYRAFAAVHGKSTWGDKTPRYVEHIPFLAKLFPTSRFIHLVRDGRDVALSYANVPFGPKTVARAALLWSQRVEMGIRDGRPLAPQRYLEVKYEALIAEPEPELVRLCDFLTVEFSPDMLDHTETTRELMLPRAVRHNPKIAQPPVAR